MSQWNNGFPGFAQFTAMDPDLFHCPVLRMQNAANNEFTESSRRLRIPAQGGFSGWMTWDRFRLFPNAQDSATRSSTCRSSIRCFPPKNRLDHLPQIPAINSWFRTGQDSDRPLTVHYWHLRRQQPLDGARQHELGRLDSWEREGDNQAYFDRYSPSGYALGVDVVVWVLTH
jgi:hypothetical protein